MHRPLFLLSLALVAAACGFDHADVGSERPTLFVREGGTTPRDSTENLYDAGGLPLVVTFNRELVAGEVAHVQLVPRPAGLGTIHVPSTNPRQILVENAVLDPRYSAYRLVLDGPSMPSPVVISYYSREHEVTEGAMIGHVFYPRLGREPEDVLIYALLPPWNEHQVELTGEEETLFGRPVLGVTPSVVYSTEEGGWFRLAGLELGAGFVVVGIIDSNRDGRYDPYEDWWGFYRNPLEQPEEVEAGVWFGALFDPPVPSLFDRVDFVLLAPGELPNPFEE